MSLKAIEAAVRASAPSHTAKLVMLVLAYHHNGQTGRCFPSYERIAEEAGLAKSSVTRAIKELCDANLIEKVKGRRAGSFNAPNSYRLLFIAQVQLEAEKERHRGYDVHGRAALPQQGTSPSPLRSEGESARKRKRSQRRAPQRRMTEDWRPSPALMKKAAEAGFEKPEIERMILDFRDWYIARGQVSASWGTDFSRWIRRQVDEKERQRAKEEREHAASHGARRGPPSTGDRIAGFHAAIVAGSGGRGGRQGGGDDGPP